MRTDDTPREPRERTEEDAGELPPAAVAGAAAPDAPDATADALGARVFRQTTSYAGLKTLASLSTLVSYALLVRVLGRREIGVFEIGMAYVGFGFVLGEGGLSATLVRKKGEVTRHEYRVALTSVLALATLLAVVYTLAAPLVGRANHFDDAELWVLRALAPLMVLRALPIVPRTRMQRELRFDQFGRVELYSTLARNATAIAAAFWFGGPWALAAAAFAQTSVAVGTSYLLSPGWVGLAFKLSTFRRLISFGSKVQATHLLHYLRENVAVALVGPALGPASVALYRFAYSYARIPSDAIGGLARVHFRMYAMCEPGSPELASAIRTALRGSILLGALVLGVLAAASEWVIPLVYSAQWLPATPIVWALVPHVLADIAIAQMIAMAQGQGRPGLAVTFYVVWSAVTWVAVATAVWFGSEHLSLVGVGQSVGTVGTALIALRWVDRQAAAPVARALARPLVTIATGAVAAFFVVGAVPGASVTRALAGVGTFLVVSGVCGALLDGEAIGTDLRDAVRSMRGRSRRPAAA